MFIFQSLLKTLPTGTFEENIPITTLAMQKLEGRVVLVTGASAGIGEAICKLLVQSGMKVVGAARRFERIQELANKMKNEKGTFFPVRCDLTKDEDIYEMFNVIKEKFGGADICINNAGMSYNSSLLDGSPREWRKMMDVNVIALCLCTKLAVASMRERGIDDGHILHVGSISGLRVTRQAGAHFYSGTKFTVRALTEGLRQELSEAKSHIRVSSVSPGFVQTEIILKATNDPKLAEQVYSSFPVLHPEDVASTVLHIISSPTHVEINDISITPTGNTGF